MSDIPPPDWAPLFQKHRHAMYRVAARILREVGRQDDAEDAVMAAIESLMKAPPSNVANWEAMMVHATKMRALDLLSSAAFRHSASEDVTNFDGPASACVEDDVVELVDRQRAAATAWDKLSVLDDRHRKVAWDYVAMERPRGEVAAELEVTPARVSQMAKEALRQLREELQAEEVEQ